VKSEGGLCYVYYMSNQKEKILLLSSSGGTGHIRAAEALLYYYQKFHPEVECKHVNITNYSSWFLKTSTVDSYHLMVKYWPGIFKKIFDYADTSPHSDSFQKIISLFKKTREKLFKIIESFQPTRIIATHFLPAALLLQQNLPCPMDVVVTDYYANQMWLNQRVRHLFVATEEIKAALEAEQPSIIVSGIPIHPNFYLPKDHTAIYHKYTIPNKNPTILILSGGLGLIDTSTIIKKLLLPKISPINVIAISGKNNKKLFNKIKKIPAHNNFYLALEFEEKIDDLMAVADIIITKPGGLTISECLYLKKPLIMINAIPGQEEKNSDYVLKNNFGLLAKNEDELLDFVANLIDKKISLTSPNDLPRPAEIILNTSR
jgi:processive 1,2-diacylglycerol beta-glucosyltransferase